MGGRGATSKRSMEATAGGGGGGGKNRESQRRYSGGGGGGDDFPVTFTDDFEVEIEDEAALDKLQAMFGRRLTNKEIGRMVGAADNATVTVSVWDEDDDYVEINVDHPYYGQKRLVSRDGDGKIFIDNSEFGTWGGSPSGVGTAVFSNQVANARKLGVDRFETWAVGDWDQAEDGGYNGYYTWAVFGYNTAVDRYLRAGLPAEYRSAKTLQDILRGGEVTYGGVKYATGRDWWKRHGSGFQGTFDLTEGSESLKVLDEYLKRKNWNVPFRL